MIDDLPCNSIDQRFQLLLNYRVVQKRHTVNDTIILQPYIIESCDFQQNVLKEIFYMTKVSV